MRAKILIATALLASSTGLVVAQTNPNASSAQSGGQPAITQPNTQNMKNNETTGAITTNAKLEEGANSFTEGQVRSRLEEAGFKNISELKKDDKGIWRGKADHQGKNVTIGFDFKGNVAVQ